MLVWDQDQRTCNTVDIIHLLPLVFMKHYENKMVAVHTKVTITRTEYYAFSGQAMGENRCENRCSMAVQKIKIK